MAAAGFSGIIASWLSGGFSDDVLSTAVGSFSGPVLPAVAEGFFGAGASGGTAPTSFAVSGAWAAAVEGNNWCGSGTRPKAHESGNVFTCRG